MISLGENDKRTMKVNIAMMKNTRWILVLGIIFFLTAETAQAQLNRLSRYKTQAAESDELELSYTNPREYEIAEIKVVGAEFLDHGALVNLSGLKVGDKIKVPGDKISGAIKKLWKQGIIGNVEIFAHKVEAGKIHLTIQLTERPRMTKFVLEGINKNQKSELNDKIKLIRGRVVEESLLKNTELTIKKHFIEKGYLNTSVKIQQVKDTTINNGVQVKFIVDRGPKVTIKNIRFEGNETFSDARLRGRMKGTNERVRFTLFKDVFNRMWKTRPSDVVSFFDSTYVAEFADIKEYLAEHAKVNFFNASKFIKDDFEEDKVKVIDFYNGKGFRDAEIVSDTLINLNKNQIEIHLKVNEGRKYYFREILWSGNYVYPDSTLAKVLGVSKGDVYDMELINKRLNFNPQGLDVSSIYMDDGYLFFRIDPVEIRVEGDSIDVEMRIYEGAQAEINKIIVKGNDRTNDHVIYREIRTIPGRKFSRNELIRTQRELSQLGYFDPETIGINPIPNQNDGTVDIEYSLTERPSDQIELSGGWGGFFGFVGTVGLVFNNFSIRNVADFSKWRPMPVGDGQKLALRVQANGRQFQTYSASFSEPWLGGKKPNNFSVNINHSVIRQGRNQFGGIAFLPRDIVSEGTLALTGATVSLGRRVRWPDDYFIVSNALSFMVYNLIDYPGLGTGFETGTANNINFNTTISRNSIDQPMYPRSGSSISLSMAFTPPYSLFNNIDYETASQAVKNRFIEYNKWMLDVSYFINVVDKLVINARTHMGFIGSYRRGGYISPFERFVLGGDGLMLQGINIGQDIIGLRGYENNSIPGGGFGSIGGIAYNKYVMEVRYPVSLNPSATIYILGFGEAGNNVRSYEEYSPFKLYRSAGFGARIFMPAFGLIGVDWGYGFDRLPGRSAISGSQFHFTIGQQLR